MTFAEYLHVEFSRGVTWGLISWLAIFPVAATAIYIMKRWSYALYLVCMAGAIYSNYTAVRGFPAYFSVPLSILCIVFDLGIVSYFLIPAVRAGYFNSRLRWWETKPRYSLQLKALAAGTWGREQVNLVNISEGGAFVRSSVTLQRGDTVDLSFEALGHQLQIPGHIVHMSGGDTWGYGIQFDLTPEIKRQIRTLVRTLVRSGHRDARPSALTFDDFKVWALRLATSGRGWIPELSMAPRSETQAQAQPQPESQAQAKSQTQSEPRQGSKRKKKKRHLKLVESPKKTSDSQGNSGDGKKKAA
jgi:hypothetical protein